MSDRHEQELGRRIGILERKVADLYRRLGQAEPELATTAIEEPDPRVIEALREGHEIEAIKLQRELTGAGLAEAKEQIDRLAAMYRPTG